MKKVLLSSILVLFSVLSVYAYETIILNYPDGENWEKAYYKKRGNEAILQYIPFGEHSSSWSRTIVIHSYEDSTMLVRHMSSNMINKMQKANPTVRYHVLKKNDSDAIFTRCTNDYNGIKAQCEFYRVTSAHGGIITIHYINKDKTDFMNNFTLWYEIIKNAKFYNSYYRNERTFNKSNYFEL